MIKATPNKGLAKSSLNLIKSDVDKLATERPINPVTIDQGLQATNISKYFRQRQVCKQISLEVRPGEIVGLLGPNGAGKTTLFNILAGIDRADSGQITLDGEVINEIPIHQRARRGLAYLPQISTAFRHMTVEENLLSVLELLSISATARAERLRNCLNTFKLEHLRKTQAITLSGGERRRLEIARVSLLNVNILLLDEPFAAIDPISINDLHQLIVELKQQGYGMIITDHNVHETLAIVDRVYIILAGEIIFHGDPDQAVTNARVRKIYLGEKFTN